ncbi:MAG TPA: diguanylate cyclase [Rhodocyclaceae bacterium]
MAQALRDLARRPYINQWLALGFVLLAFGVALAYSLYQERQRIEAVERERLSTQAKVVDDNLARQLDSINRVLAGVRTELQYWTRVENGGERASRHLKTLSDAMPGIRTLLVIDAEGTVTAANREELIGKNFRQREYFQAVLNNPNPNTLYLGPPFQTSLGVDTMNVVRMIPGAQGRFAGIVSATLDPAEFRILIDSVRYAPDMRAALIHGSGKLFMMAPNLDGLVGSDVTKPGSVFSRHLASGLQASVMTGASTLTGEARLAALRSIQPAALAMDKPLVVAMSRDLSALLAPWRHDVYAQGGLMAVLALLSTISLWLYQRRQLAYDRLTARHAAEQKAMLDNEVLLRNVIQSVDEGVLLLDSQGQISFANPAAETLLGLTRQELLGTPCTHLIHSAGEATSDCPLCVAQNSGEPFASREFEFRRSDGSRFPVSIRATPTSGEAAGLVVAFHDISAQKNAEAKLATSERNLHVLIDATPGSAILLDLEGRIETINAIGARRLGNSAEELVGRDFFALLPDEVGKRRWVMFAGVCANGQPATMVDQRGQYTFETNLFPVLDAAGQTQRVAIYARDITETRREEATQALFHELGELLLRREISPDTLIWHFCRRIVPIFDFAFAWIGRKQDDGHVEVAAGVELSDGYLARLKGLGRRWDAVTTDPVCNALRQGKLQVAETGPGDGSGWPALAWEYGAHYLVSIPLTLDGGTYGALTLGVRDSVAPDADKLKRLEDIGSRLSLAMEAAIQQERLNLMETALETTGNAVFITDANGSILWANPSFGRLTGYAPAEVVGCDPSILNSGAHDAAFHAEMWQNLLAGNIWQGEIVEAHRSGSRFTAHQTITPLRDPEGRISHFVSILEDITEQQAAQERIAHLAHYDALTDLPNRRLFFDRLGQALAQSRRTRSATALLFLDLDRFKEVNDRRGHNIGDQLLKAVAERLRSLVRESDTIARLAGDEFTVILSGIDGRDDCARVAEKIVATLGRPYELAGSEESIGVSLGIALSPDDATESEDLVRAADQAMYAAKAAGRGAFRFFGDD